MLNTLSLYLRVAISQIKSVKDFLFPIFITFFSWFLKLLELLDNPIEKLKVICADVFLAGDQITHPIKVQLGELQFEDQVDVELAVENAKLR